MYNTAKRLTTVCSILVAFNILAYIMFLLYFPNSGLGFPIVLTITIYLTTTTAISLLLILALRGLCDALDFNFVKDAENNKELKKRIHILEETKK